MRNIHIYFRGSVVLAFIIVLCVSIYAAVNSPLYWVAVWLATNAVIGSYIHYREAKDSALTAA